MICKKCGVGGNFTWDQQNHENTGKWRLLDLNMERPHDCPGMKVEEASLETTMPNPQVKCPQCDPLKDSAWMEREKLQHHVRTAHFGFW
jgi:hypothetical protein